MKPPDPPGLNDPIRVIVIVVAGLAGLGVTLFVGLITAIECSEEVGSVDARGGGLASPCDYAGAVGTVAKVGIVLFVGVGFVLGAHRANRGTAAVAGAVVVLAALAVRGLLRVPLG